MATIRVAAIQGDLRWQQPMPNMLHLRKVVDNLPKSVQCVVLPEGWAGMSMTDPELKKQAEQSLQFLRTLARAGRIHVVGGTILRPHAEGSLENVCHVIDSAGEIAGQYVKRTLFGSEQDLQRRGERPLVIEAAGIRVAVLICADLWCHAHMAELCGQADLVCVPAKTSVSSDLRVTYAQTLWQGLALTRSMETGIPIVVSDWASGRHASRDVDVSVGSAHAPGMTYDPGVLHRHPREGGTMEASARSYTSAEQALGGAVHYTAGATTVCDPGQRPDITKVQRSLPRGEPGVLIAEIDLDAVEAYRAYRRSVGLMSPAGAPRDSD